MTAALGWIGPADADVVVFNKGGRDFRWKALQAGEEAPREFFYGYVEVAAARGRIAMAPAAGALPGRLGAAASFLESLASESTHLGLRPLSLRLMASSLRERRVLISFTDGFSTTLGLASRGVLGRAVRIGGFHCLSDLALRARPWARAYSHERIRRALAGLDHAFFFGPADRDECVRRYGVDAGKTSVFPFGVDTAFWRPESDAPPADFVVAVGQDPNRDYDLLAAAPGSHPTRIITRQPIAVPPGAAHVKTTVGDYFGSDSMSDADIRRLYNAARGVIVPLKDVFQPSGYSVTLQAMSCARPVVLTRTKGLWAPELFRDGENCLLVPPGDGAALGAAIGRVRGDEALARRIGAAARATVEAHFQLSRNADSLAALVARGEAIATERRA
ncbi:MAG: glycosyltransferase family 4 protein [Alphaproteobacteria bacterium]|nr:glycosyltransferase family 4 protein [Alphaproteobacteria bacterium]